MDAGSCGDGRCIDGFCVLREDAGAARDGGLDAGDDGGADAGVDAGADGGEDAGTDAGLDAGSDGGSDAGCLEDSSNCGRCGHSCLGGLCVAGKCQPVELANSGKGGQVHSIAVTRGDLFWVNRIGSVYRLPLDGGPEDVLAIGQEDPYELVLRKGAVYWLNLRSGQVLSCLETGCVTPTLVASGPVSQSGFASGITADDTWVYWNYYQAGTGTLCRAPLTAADAGCEVLGQTPGSAFRMVATPQWLYFTNPLGPAVQRIPIDGGAITNMTSQVVSGVATGMTLIDGDIYWVFFDLTAGKLVRTLLDGGPDLDIATNLLRPYAVAADATHVYWSLTGADAGASVFRAPRNGGDGGPFESFGSPADQPRDIKIDDCCLYWGTVNGGIVRLAK
jgi:hypothetical protein